MTWAEFCIRQHAYRRMEKNSWYKTREVAYFAMVGSHMNPKKLPRSKEAFMPLEGGVVKEITDEQRSAIKEAQKRYANDIKKLKNG